MVDKDFKKLDKEGQDAFIKKNLDPQGTGKITFLAYCKFFNG